MWLGDTVTKLILFMHLSSELGKYGMVLAYPVFWASAWLETWVGVIQGNKHTHLICCSPTTHLLDYKLVLEEMIIIKVKHFSSRMGNVERCETVYWECWQNSQINYNFSTPGLFTQTYSNTYCLFLLLLAEQNLYHKSNGSWSKDTGQQLIYETPKLKGHAEGKNGKRGPVKT